MPNTRKIRAELEELFHINLNGGWESFYNELKEIKHLVNTLSVDEVKSLRASLNEKLDKAI